MTNIAHLLLQKHPQRLIEAQELAEEALSIKNNIEKNTVTIWTTYDILAGIADKQGNIQEAKNYRRLAREAKANFAGTRYELKQEHSELILAVAQSKNVEAPIITAILEGIANPDSLKWFEDV